MELTIYLHTAESDLDISPLEWWRQHEVNLPLVAMLAKKYLCVPATSSPSERAFSASGNIVTCKKSENECLKPEKLVFLAFNL